MAKNHKGETAYDMASKHGHHPIGLLLLEYQDHHVATSPQKILLSPNVKVNEAPASIIASR